MAIIKWQDPFGLTPRTLWPSFLSEEDFWPEEKQGLTVYEADNDVVAKANIPGIPADKVDVDFESGVLTIKAEHEETKEEKKKKKTVYRQARQAKYFYTTSVPCPINANKIEAEVKDGVVTVTLPKTKEAQSRKIKVREAGK